MDFRLGRAWGGKQTEELLTVAQAFKKAQVWGSLCATGQDPRQVLESEPEEDVWEEPEPKRIVLFEELTEYYFKHAKLVPDTVSNYRSTVKHHLKWLKSRDVTTITVDECLERYRQRQEKSRSQAWESLKLLSAMWTLGKGHFKDGSGQKLLGENPIKDLKEQIKRWDYNPNPNKPVIDIHSVGRFIAHLEERRKELKHIPGEYAYNEHSVCTILLLCLFTGMRISETLNMLWDGVDLEAGLICIGQLKNTENTKRTKNGRNYTIQMSDYVWSLMREISQQRVFVSPYVFPRWRNPAECMRYQMRSVAKLCDSMDLYFRPRHEKNLSRCLPNPESTKTT